MTLHHTSSKNFKQYLLAALSSAIISMIYSCFINKFCITIYEGCIPGRENYYSKTARFPMILPAVIFIIINITIFFVSKKKYKMYAYLYIILTTLITLISFIFTNTNIVRGI